MAPEYASEGLFSIKSDVFSFGVLTLEIISEKNIKFPSIWGVHQPSWTCEFFQYLNNTCKVLKLVLVLNHHLLIYTNIMPLFLCVLFFFMLVTGWCWCKDLLPYLKKSSCILIILLQAWQLWKDELWLQLVDTSLGAECHTLQMRRCVNIALLCVQENAVDRPTMSEVATMLSSDSMALPEPKHPAYFHVRVGTKEASAVVEPSSVDVTISTLCGR